MRNAIRELKSGLSRYVARARAGEVIEITSHDKPVARLVGVPAAGPAGVSRLLARGAATWSGGKPALHAPAVLSSGGKSVSDILLEDRG
jgi:prevent-host-death family protein